MAYIDSVSINGTDYELQDSALNQEVSDFKADIAPTYSASAVYPVGAYVYYNGDLYRCTTAITTAEAWTSAHWTAVALGNDVSDLKSAIQTIGLDIEDGILVISPVTE